VPDTAVFAAFATDAARRVVNDHATIAESHSRASGADQSPEGMPQGAPFLPGSWSPGAVGTVIPGKGGGRKGFMKGADEL